MGGGKSSWLGESAVILTKTQLANFKSSGSLSPVFARSVHETGSDVSKKLVFKDLKDLINNKKALSVEATGLSLSKAILTLNNGKIKAFNVTTAPSTATGKAVTWNAFKTKIPSFYLLCIDGGPLWVTYIPNKWSVLLWQRN